MTKPAHYVGQSVYDGKRPLTPKQVARAKETVRKSNAAKETMAWGLVGPKTGRLAPTAWPAKEHVKNEARDLIKICGFRIARVKIVEVRE